jgi:hypothetical protein
MLARIVAALRRFWNRRSARRLLARGLPRGVERPLLALPAPPARFDLALLLRLPILPPPPHDLGVARPRRFRLDEAFRVPSEVDVPPSPRPPPERRVRPRTPIARAPLPRFSPRKFRLDAQGAPANENILAVDRLRAVTWLSPGFRRQYVDLPWMAREHIDFLGPTRPEWFAAWWEGSFRARVGAGDPGVRSRPDEIDWAMEHCKEQMLIRRDVGKDERPPPPQAFSAKKVGAALRDWKPPDVPALIPAKEWFAPVDPSALASVPAPERAPREAYLQWRTLLAALSEQ